MTNLKTAFENIGMGISVAGLFVPVNGKNLWVSFMATSEGRGQKRTWHVNCTHYAGDPTKPIRVEATKRDCYRYEAAEAALRELIPYIN